MELLVNMALDVRRFSDALKTPKAQNSPAAAYKTPKSQTSPTFQQILQGIIFVSQIILL